MIRLTRSGFRLLKRLSTGRRGPVPGGIWLAACLAAATILGLPELQRLSPIQLGLDLAAPAAPAPSRGARAPVVENPVGVASIIDGDTLEIHGQRIRLHAVDAPESRQTCQRANGSSWRCGAEAARALDAFVGRATVSCTRKDVDRYGRLVARCSARGQDLGAWMVREGWAVAYRRYGKAYVGEEDAARQARRGLWSGRFDMPWDWRRGSRG